MSTRQYTAVERIYQSVNELVTHMDAYNELAEVVRVVAQGSKVAPAIADRILKLHISNGFLNSTFYRPGEAPTQSLPLGVTILQDLLASAKPPMGISEVSWDKLTDDRRQLAALCAEYPEKVEPAIRRRTLRPWFTTKLFQKGSIHVNADLLVSMVFAEADRQCAA